MDKLFFAYPNEPKVIGEIIEKAINEYNERGKDLLSWKAMDVIGNFIPDAIIKQISQRTFVADITVLNENVIYELGFAIGQKKFILITKNSSIKESNPSIQEVGIFDTLGYIEYQNSNELASILLENKSNQTYKGYDKLNIAAPIYLLDTFYKTDCSARIISRIKAAKFYYRSFDPSEIPRLSAFEAIREVSQSYGVIVQLIPKSTKDSSIHNIRGAFLAGLANGMNVPLKIIQNGFDPVPIDYRDIVAIFKREDDINEIIAEFVKDVVNEIQEVSPPKFKKQSILENLDFGASAAENEMRKLQYYYLKIDAFSKALRGEVQLVIGRKGTGKSAIFFQIINKEKSSTKNIVLDLQPDSYKLIKFKEQVLDLLEEGSFQHTIMAIWEYLLLLEVANKILINDKSRHLTSENLLKPYKELEEAYSAENYLTQGDFSDRMASLLEKLDLKFKTSYGNQENIRLSTPEVTGLIHQTNIKNLKDTLVNYLKFKERVWILFDNIDKGWPSSGLVKSDLIIIRSLIDASKNIQRFFERSKVNFYPIIFLRSDVYHQLVIETSDRQKESKVSLDWIDQDLLKRLIELRVSSNSEDEDMDFNNSWRQIATSHYKGEDSLQFILDRCLMRPRFLINLLNYCKSFAINLNHSKINEEDITKGLQAYSSDLLTDIDLEIRDVFSNSESLLTIFYQSASRLSQKELETLIYDQLNSSTKTSSVIETLLWYGFLGVVTSSTETTYIYNENYNIDLLKTIIKKKGDNLLYCINPSFWSALKII